MSMNLIDPVLRRFIQDDLSLFNARENPHFKKKNAKRSTAKETKVYEKEVTQAYDSLLRKKPSLSRQDAFLKLLCEMVRLDPGKRLPSHEALTRVQAIRAFTN